jgi:hypothetical protein
MTTSGELTEERRAMDVAFCCFGLLCRRNDMERILSILPEDRREEIRGVLSEVADWPKERVAERLTELRRVDFAGARRQCGAADAAAWESLPPSLQRSLCARGQ